MLVGTPDKGIPAKRRERISNVPASITVVVTADLSARMVEYRIRVGPGEDRGSGKGHFDVAFVRCFSGFVFGGPTAHVRAGPPTRSGASTLSHVADRPGIHGNLGGAAPDFMSLILQQ
jgi:hypothetical protein